MSDRFAFKMAEKKIILITGNTETLGYFSKELAIYLHEAGAEVFIWDMRRPSESISAFEALQDKEEWVLVTFNFIGLNGEGQFGDGLSTIWETNGIRIISIMVDSPIYYYRQLIRHTAGLSVACIDRYHVAYVRRWHPYIENVYFWPLCGNEPIDDLWLMPGVCAEPPYLDRYMRLPIAERPIDIIFIANYVTRESIYDSIAGAEREYRDFLHDICDQMIRTPSLPLEETLYERLKREFPDEEEEAYPEAMFHMLYVDLYVRSYFRSRTVAKLVDAGYTVHCVGQDWDRLELEHPENLVHSGVMMTSADCLRAIERAKISLNVMPHFKAGAHDRVFTSMLAGCVSLTDPSEYLNEVITPWENYAPFTLEEPESVCEAAGRLLRDTEYAQTVADNGCAHAAAQFTWKRNAESILDALG